MFETAAVSLVALLTSVQPGQLFSDQTVSQGVQFTHHAPPADDIFLGAGAAWGDYDGDGDIDLYVCDQDGPNKLFRNDGNRFTEVGASLGVAPSGIQSNGALFGDYDNDGDADLYVMNRGDNIMYRNDGPSGIGGWTFTDVTAEHGLESFGRTSSAVYGDYDNDGWLDLYVGVHFYDTLKPTNDGEAYNPSNADRLFHNVPGPGGERTFEDVAPEIFGVNVLYMSICHSVGFLDFDLDRDLDIFIVNEVFVPTPGLHGTQMWRNDGPDGGGGWIFSDVSDEVHEELTSNPMGLGIGDYNNDGWWDLSMSDRGPNHLLINQDGVFTDVALISGVQRETIPETGGQQFGWGILWTDYDLDGWEDFYLCAGTSPGADQPNPLFHNDGNPPENTFTDVTAQAGAASDWESGRGVVKADYDLDGDEDLYIVNYGADAVLARNDQSGGDYLAIKLVGTLTNRDAIGARVTLTDSALPKQYRMVQSGSTTNGGHDLTLYFGVTGADSIDSITIEWPSGLASTLSNVPVNQRMTVTEVVPTPSVLRVVGAHIVASNAISIFKAEAEYTDGAVVDITAEAEWSVAPDTYCTFISPGQMSTFGLAAGQSELVTVTASYESLEAVLPVEVVDSGLVDLEPPTIEFALDGGGTSMTTTETSIVLEGAASDNVGIVAMVWSSDKGQSGPCQGIALWKTGPISLEVGSNQITVTANDSTGNRANVVVTVTRTLPLPPQVIINDNGEDIYGSGNDNDSVDGNEAGDENDDDTNVDDVPVVPNENETDLIDANANTVLVDPVADPVDDAVTTPIRNASGGGSTAGACGAFGMIAGGWMLVGLALMRRGNRLSIPMDKKS